MEIPEMLELEIVTPDRLLFSGEVDEVRVPAVGGSMGVLPGHAPLLSELEIGVISFRQGTQESWLFCSWGFVEVLPDKVSVLAQVAESSRDIDVEKAEADRERAEKLLRTRDEELDYGETMTLLREANARLEVARKPG